MRIYNKKISIIYKVILCIVGIFSLVAVTGFIDGSTDLRILGMFTTLSNLLCVIYFSVDIFYLLIHYKSKAIVEWNPLLKGIVTMAITLTFLVAQFILKMTFSFDSFYNASFLGLHYIVPIMTVFDWILFDKKGYTKLYSPIIWSIFPILYMTICYICVYFGINIGVSSDSRYPYPFMDIDKFGISTVILYDFLMAIIYVSTGYIYCLIDNLMIKKRKKS